MSMDNGTLLTNHPCGGFTLLNYFLSNESLPTPTEDSPHFETIEEAIDEYERRRDEHEKETGYPYDEYGLDVRVTIADPKKNAPRSHA